MLQVADSVDAPEQARPPLEGAGLLQSRVRTWVPPPHPLLHVPHALQGPQFPSANYLNLIYKELLGWLL